MPLHRQQGRAVGLLYVLASIPGFFGLLYVPSKVVVHGDAAAKTRNLATFESLFRAGIAADLAGQALFVFVALALYDLLKGVNRRHALMMLTLILAYVPIAFLNEVNAIAALVLARPAFLSVLSQPEWEALAMLFLSLHGAASTSRRSCGGCGSLRWVCSSIARDSCPVRSESSGESPAPPIWLIA